MCSCEPGFVCSKCRDTPADDRYLDDEPAERRRVTVVFVNEDGTTTVSYVELS